jgi:hypothetical protein
LKENEKNSSILRVENGGVFSYDSPSGGFRMRLAGLLFALSTEMPLFAKSYVQNYDSF